jgi:hypothetical protein
LSTRENTSRNPTSPNGFPPFMRPAELAQLLHLKPKTLAEYRVSGEGPEFIKAGPRLCIYTAAAVEAWLAKGRRTSTSAVA